MFISPNDITTLTLEITSFCNLHCPQCPRFNAAGYLNNELALDHLNVDILNNIHLNNFPNLENIIFEGDNGDALMHPHFLLFLDFFKEYKVQLTTNGSIRSTKWWQELAKFPNLSVTFSIDGLDDTNEIYRIGASFNKIIDNAKAFIDAGGVASWKYIIFRHNEAQVPIAKTLADDIGFDKFFTIISERSWFHGDKWEVFINGKYRYDIHPSTSLVEFNGTAHKVIKDQTIQANSCLLKKYGDLYINYKGHVLPCCMTSSYTYTSNIKSQMWQRIVGDIAYINLYDFTLSDILSSDFYISYLPNSFNGFPWIAPCCATFCSQ